MRGKRSVFGDIVHHTKNTIYFHIFIYMYLYITFTSFSIYDRLVRICMSLGFHLHMCKKPLHCSVVSSICIILVGPVLPSMFN